MMSRDGPLLIAHRGFATEFPENTLTAVRRATEYADGIEVDVRCCGSGELVGVHDRRVGPIWRRRRVDRLSKASISALQIETVGEPVSTVPAVLDAVPAGQRLILELKSLSAAERVISLVGDDSDDIVLSSANRRALSHIAEESSALHTAFVHLPSLQKRVMWPLASRLPGVNSQLVDVQSIVREATDLGCHELHVRYELCLYTDLVDRAHASDLTVGAWTVHSTEVYERLAAMEVDAIFADTWRVRPAARG